MAIKAGLSAGNRNMDQWRSGWRPWSVFQPNFIGVMAFNPGMASSMFRANNDARDGTWTGNISSGSDQHRPLAVVNMFSLLFDRPITVAAMLRR